MNLAPRLSLSHRDTQSHAHKYTHHNHPQSLSTHLYAKLAVTNAVHHLYSTVLLWLHQFMHHLEHKLYYTFPDGASPAFELTSKTTVSLKPLITHFVPTYSHQQAQSFFYQHHYQPLGSSVILLHFISSSTVQLGVLLF